MIVMTYVVSSSRKIDCHCLLKRKSTECSQSMPSWAPNWAQGQMHHLLGHAGTVFRTSKDWPPVIRLSKWSKVMETEGFRIDIITQYSTTLRKGDFNYDALTISSSGVIQSIWRSICNYPTFQTSHKYVNGESAIFAFLQTLSAGCLILAIKRGHRRDYNEVPKSTWLADGATYLMKVFGNTDLATDELERASIGGDAHDWIGCCQRTCGQRKFFRTKDGYYGLGSSIIEEGDLVCVLLGGVTPFILRPDGDHYNLVGECYVHGLMHGEAIEMMEKGEREREIFCVR